MSDVRTIYQLVDHLYKRMDAVEAAAVDALGQVSPRAARAFKEQVGRIYKTPNDALRAAEERDFGPEADETRQLQKAIMDSVRKNPDRFVVGKDPGWEGAPWAGRGGR